MGIKGDTGSLDFCSYGSGVKGLLGHCSISLSSFYSNLICQEYNARSIIIPLRNQFCLRRHNV